MLRVEVFRRSAWEIIEGGSEGDSRGILGDPGGSDGGQLKISEVSDKRPAQNTEGTRPPDFSPSARKRANLCLL